MTDAYKTLPVPEGFVADKDFEEALGYAEKLALTGTTKEKESFVAWCHDAITYNTEQLAFSGQDEYRYSLYRVKAQYAVYFDAMTASESKTDAGETIQSLCAYSGLSKSQIYSIAKRLGRLPTRSELDNRPKGGRPKKY